MTEFKKGDRIVFVEDDRYFDVKVPKGTLATYDDIDPADTVPYVLLDTGERVVAWRGYIAHAEPETPADVDTTNPDGSVTARSNLRFVPDAPQQVEDGLFTSANRSLAAALRTGPLTAPLDPSKVKPGDMVTLEKGDRKVTAPVSERTISGWYEQGTWFLDVHDDDDDKPMSFAPSHWTLIDHQPEPEPEPEWEPGTVADIYVDPVGTVRAVRARVGWYWCADTEEVYSDDDVENVRPLVVIDPATVGVEDLRRVLANADYGFDAQARAVLRHLGIEVPR